MSGIQGATLSFGFVVGDVRLRHRGEKDGSGKSEIYSPSAYSQLTVEYVFSL